MKDASLPLFYSNPVPLDSKKHVDLAMSPHFGLGFTRSVNAVPVNIIEMPQVCHSYPICFSPDRNATPVAILGLRDNENLYVDEYGEWLPDMYIPAYIRRYPFIFSELPGGDRLSLCFDMVPEVLVEEGGTPFFEANGAPSQLSKNALEFCKSYHAASQHTLEFSQVLAGLDLLVQREAQIDINGGKRINFSGFKIIDEKKLSELPADALFMLHEKGFLPYLYAHLFSGAQWARVTRLLNDRIAGVSPTPPKPLRPDQSRDMLLRLKFPSGTPTNKDGE